MKNERVIAKNAKIASQPSAVSLAGTSLIVFVLIEVDGKYYKLFYKAGIILNDMFSDILVSSVGDNVWIEFLLSPYKGAMEIKKFVNKTHEL